MVPTLGKDHFKEQAWSKYMEKMFHYTKTINCLGQTTKSSSKVLFKLDFFHGVLYCCVRYSNIKCQDEIFKTYH